MAMQEWLAAAREAAEAAGEIIAHHAGKGVAEERKSDDSPVTVADREAEQAIREIISAACPGHGFVGEEFGGSDEASEYLWLVDPLDGTKSFVRGYPFYSTQIALMHKGRVVLGVSHAPAFGEQAFALRGEGAWLNGERIFVSSTRSIEQATVSGGNLASLAADVGAWSRYGQLLRRVHRGRGYGDFYHYHLLASGRIDAVIESDLNILDIAALSLIVEEAGGRFTALDGKPVSRSIHTALASNTFLHGPLKQAIDWQEQGSRE